MCGRVKTNEELERELDDTDIGAVVDSICQKTRWNVAPSSTMTVLIIENNVITRKTMTWGFKPSWTPASKSPKLISNARAETIWEKTMFKRAIKERRAVMVTSGFYEWKRDVDPKEAYCIESANGGSMFMASIWQVGSFPLPQVCNITVGPNQSMAAIHDRMPVLLKENEIELWLRNDERDFLDQIMKPCPDDWIKIFQVSNYVNNSRNEGAKCAEPI